MDSERDGKQPTQPGSGRLQLLLDGPDGPAVELPFVVGVLSDLTGARAVEVLPVIEKREFLAVDPENFDAFLESQKPRVEFKIRADLGGQRRELSIDITFRSLDDFLPDRVVESVPELNELLQQRRGIEDTNEEAQISLLDEMLSEQVNAIVHHEDFRRLESAWRGLEYLVSSVEPSPSIQILVLNIGKAEIDGVFRRHAERRRLQSPLFDLICRRAEKGSPFACLLGDYEFDHSSRDVMVLDGMGQISAIAFAPFLAAASPSLVGLECWSDLGDVMDVENQEGPEYAAWNELRNQPDSRYLGLVAPRFLARAPYSVVHDPVEGFPFDEDANAQAYCWANSVYLMAINLARAFSEDGWCERITGHHSGGRVDLSSLLSHVSAHGEGRVSCPTELAIGRNQEYRLSELGLIPLSYLVNTTGVVFSSAQSLKRPTDHDGQVSESDRWMNRLPNLFCGCRFAHYLSRFFRSHLESSPHLYPYEITDLLESWLATYVAPEGETAPVHQKPLQGFSVRVDAAEGCPGSYDVRFELRLRAGGTGTFSGVSRIEPD